ncbi:diguanylate cyclase [Paenibacillus sp. YYML68]|uniref:diguanylate cyclase n=1 Tax=Paenibacillus sp. YYML68 TaxID=2909250 RepID=UPI0024919FD2|nr:diguanylate cyclase [Paenibacillus sp. YYML68]
MRIWKRTGNSLTAKLSLTIIVCILLVIVIFASVFSTISKQWIIEQLDYSTKQHVTYVSKRMEAEFEYYNMLSTQIIVDPDIREQVITATSSSSAYDKFMARRKIEERLILINVSFQKKATIKIAIRNDWSTMAWYNLIEQGYGKVVWFTKQTEGFESYTTSDVMVLGRALRDLNTAQTLGVILIEVDRRELMQELSPLTETLKGDYAVVDATGQVVLSSQGDISPFMEALTMLDRTSFGSEEIAVTRTKRESLYFSHPGLDEWTLITKVNTDELTQAADKVWSVAAMLSLVALLAAGTVGLVSTRKISKPLIKLSSLMRIGSSGNLSIRSAYQSNDEIGHVSDSFNKLMEQMSDLVGQRIEDARIQTKYELERQQSEQSEQLKSALLAVASTLDLEQVLRIAVERMSDFVPYTRGSVCLLENDAIAAQAVQAGGRRAAVFSSLRQELRPGSAAYEAYHSMEPVVMKDPRCAEGSYRLAVPLLSRSRIVGMLEFVSRHEYSQKEYDTILIYAAQIAVSIENACMYSTMTEMAVKDGLTGLYNRRYFIQVAEEQVQQAEAGSRQLALLLFDIDHFKKVNDTYGHPAGDLVLQHVAQGVKAVVGAAGICARYGGEEFAVVLPECSVSEAAALAEQIRSSIAAQSVVTDGVIIRVTVSLGLSVWSHEKQSLNELLKTADEALYRAKSNGRNQVCCSA